MGNYICVTCGVQYAATSTPPSCCLICEDERQYIDRAWVQRPHNSIIFWEGNTFSPWEGITLICCGGHFAGGTVLHWKNGAQGKEALLTGDIIERYKDAISGKWQPALKSSK